MKYEYIIEWGCTKCGSEGREFTGIMDVEKSKAEIDSRPVECPDCRIPVKKRKIKKQFIGKTKIEGEVYI